MGIRKNNSSRELSLFAESAAAVNRVVLQHMSVNLGLWEQTSNLSGLSPPSESRLMQRRKSQVHLAPNYTSGGSGYITTCETELWLCYIRAPLSIFVKMQNNIYFWGRPL